MKTFNEWIKENKTLLEFDPNRGAEGRSIPQGKSNSSKLMGNRDAQCDSIQDPYQKFKCQLIVNAKNSIGAFHHHIPSRKPWDNQSWTEEELTDLKKAYDQANWRRGTENDMRTGEPLNQDSEMRKVAYPRRNRTIAYNPAEELALKLKQQEYDREQ